MRLRILLVPVLLTASAWAGIVDDVRLALAQNNFSAAESALNSYRSQQGINGDYLEAYSWLGRAALEQGLGGQEGRRDLVEVAAQGRVVQRRVAGGVLERQELRQ